MKQPQLILGGPGCGKTTRLLEIVERELEAGVSSQEIAFVSFTKAAAREARERAAAKFKLDPEKDLPWFRTIHSLAYHLLGLDQDEVMRPRDWKEFGEVYGFQFTYGEAMAEDDPDADGAPQLLGTDGDKMRRINDYARTTMRDLKMTWEGLGEPVDWWSLEFFTRSLIQFKKSRGDKMDFTDMLSLYLTQGLPLSNIRTAVIDEGQDLTRMQWNVVDHAFCDANNIYVGGDDDQAIYRWAGADVDRFLNLSSEPEILSHSYRLPSAVYWFARRIARRITRRYEKKFQPASHDGAIYTHIRPELVDVGAIAGSWLLLARNRHNLGQLENMCRQQGIPYTSKAPAGASYSHLSSLRPAEVAMILLWERMRRNVDYTADARQVRELYKMMDLPVPTLRETQKFIRATLPTLPWSLPWYRVLKAIPATRRDYYITCLANGARLSDSPRVRIETIHGAKGAEADNVILISDISERTDVSYNKAPDHEHRVFYVGATRAKCQLHIILPMTSRYYGLI